jgi:internalin A
MAGKYAGEIKGMTREELLQLIDKAADEGLTELDLAGLELEELPPEIGKCTQLETLVLGKWDREKHKSIGNKLTEFPDVVLQLTNLKILSIPYNQMHPRGDRAIVESDRP